MRALAIVAAALLLTGCDDPGVIEAKGGNVRLEVIPAEVAAERFPQHVLVNDSKQTVVYGHSYDLERWAAGKWKDVDFRCAFSGEAISLDPGDRSPAESLGGCGDEMPLEPGIYRVSKDVDVAEGDATDDRLLVETFTVS